MEDKKWTHAAWMAIGAAVLVPAALLLSILADLMTRRGLPGVAVDMVSLIVSITATVLSLIALYRFRELLNDLYAYHGVDALVTFLIVAIVAFNLVAVVGQVLRAVLGASDYALGAALILLVPFLLVGVAIGVVTIVLGARLLSLQNDPQHLIRPYAVVSIVTGACFALVVLVPLGLVMLIVGNVVLALLFFRANEVEPTVEFV